LCTGNTLEKNVTKKFWFVTSWCSEFSKKKIIKINASLDKHFQKQRKKAKLEKENKKPF
jgi:hypothetical protein